MKLAEALQERKDLKTKIADLEERISSVCLVQEGDKPGEDPIELMAEYDEAIKAYEKIVREINRTNATVVIDGATLTDLIAKKDALEIKRSGYSEFAEKALDIQNRVRGSEIKLVATVDAKKLHKETDQIAKEIRLLDNKLQQANWTYDLIEE